MNEPHIILSRYKGRDVAVLVVGNRLDDLMISLPEGVPPPGTIFRAIVDRPLKSQGGAIVRLPGGSGYLRSAKGLAQGSVILVQVTGFSEDGKAIPVSDRILFKGRYAIVTPGAKGINLSRRIRDDDRRDGLLLLASEVTLPQECGMILRSGAENAPDDAVFDDITALSDLASAVLADAKGTTPEWLVDGPSPAEYAWREWHTPGAPTDATDSTSVGEIEDLIEPLLRPHVTLAAGAHMYVESTRAMVTVDVNSGSDLSLAAGLKANLAAVRALPAQLRCRGLGGQITIDMAPSAKKFRHDIEAALKSAFRKDPVDTVLAGWTPLGNYELQRKRERFPLTRALSE